GILVAVNSALAQGHGHHHSHRHQGGLSGGPPPGYFSPFYLAGIGPYGPFVLVPPPPPMLGPLVPLRSPPQYDSGNTRAGPIPPRSPQGIKVSPGLSKTKRGDPEKSSELATLGDRLFRAGNLKRASERYDQAIRADARSASPR